MRRESRELAVGQVWSDMRVVGREVEIVGLDARYVYVRSIRLAPGRWKKTLGRNTRVMRHRFKPGAQGFSYARDAA